MKQAIKKVAPAKALPVKGTPAEKALKANNAEEVSAKDQQKTNLFNRFLEANCDCV